jgi:hypothetical protein
MDTSVLHGIRIPRLKKPLGRGVDPVNSAKLGGCELVAKRDRLVRLTRAICKTQETDLDLAVAVIGLGPEPDLDWALLDTGLLDKAINTHLIKLIDVM